MLEIKAGDNRVGIYPELGGAIAYWLRRDMLIFHPVNTSRLVKNSHQIIAAYPMLPYSNRIAGGKFTFNGKHYQLSLNALNGKDSIHGNGWQRAWTLEAFNENSVILSMEYRPDREQDKEWPFAYLARLYYQVSEGGLMVGLSCQNIDLCVQPVGMGFHPYIPRRESVELGFSARTVWNNGTDGLPEGRMLIEGQWNFDRMRPLEADTILDNCYVNWNRAAFVRWKNENAFLTIQASSIFQHLVVSTPQNQPYFMLEPATNMNNAINMPEISDHGLVILKPDQTLKGSIFYSFTGI